MAPRGLDSELRRALLRGDGPGVVRGLLGRKADPNVPIAEGQTPLYLAVERDDATLCRLLLVYQADTSRVFSSRVSIANTEVAKLVWGWDRGDVARVLAVLEGVVIDAAEAHDVTLLRVALASIEIAGGNSEHSTLWMDEQKNSLLHRCVQKTGLVYGRQAEALAAATTRALLALGLLVDGRNQQDETALMIAIREMNTLVRCGVDRIAVPLEPARTLLEARADIELVYPQTRETVLMQAAQEGNLVACELLLEFGADPHQQNAQGKMALDLSADHPEVQSLLHAALVERSPAPAALMGCRQSEVCVQASRLRHSALHSTGSDAGRWRAAGANAISAGGKAPINRFSLIEKDQEFCSVEGVLNQVDLEESYDTDWNTAQVASAG